MNFELKSLQHCRRLRRWARAEEGNGQGPQGEVKAQPVSDGASTKHSSYLHIISTLKLWEKLWKRLWKNLWKKSWKNLWKKQK
jgi:hypothetical protein